MNQERRNGSPEQVDVQSLAGGPGVDGALHFERPLLQHAVDLHVTGEVTARAYSCEPTVERVPHLRARRGGIELEEIQAAVFEVRWHFADCELLGLFCLSRVLIFLSWCFPA